MLKTVPESINFPKEEENILKYWEDINAFNECSKISKGRPRYSFYDGPPFATGLPHYGHILAGTIKDIVTRYAFQSGFQVERRFGWDCHGLPVEYEIDKTLGIKGPEDVEKMGIDKYNAECRKIVMRYSKEWEFIVSRIGRWIDFKNDYKTLYPWFMESVWWVFSELWSKGLVYKGIKIMPYSTGCNTPLSNFETSQNYKEVIDPTVVVKFELVKYPNTYILAWTTTPWTLPSNLALCVKAQMIYLKLKEEGTGHVYIISESRVGEYFKKVDDNTYKNKEKPITYTVIQKVNGMTFEGEKYSPLFPYFKDLDTCFRVLVDSYVTEDSGTGIVHQAPYFGEDDFRVCLKYGVIKRDQAPVCPVDANGRFTEPVEDFIGLYVKDADKSIIAHLKEKQKLFSVGNVNHNYPFCWRSDTPLIYKAVDSWFIRVEEKSEELLRCNNDTYWVPDFVKEKRFANWLKEARDWAFSRNRYWGTPIPLWVSEDMEEIVCVSSIKELEELTNEKINDIHRESIDHLTIPSKRAGQPPLRRIKEVFDCWFESGSMPYAQVHYPFENADIFEKQFPADFIAEGIDQTRGWFYTLLVISTLLFKKPPFKNLIVNGLVLAADGQKMSKSKRNYPDPMEIINKFGGDALRIYLINSPVVRADKLRFREEGVKDVLKDVLLPWYNAYRFLIQNVQYQETVNKMKIKFDDEKVSPKNLMDKWILSFTQSLCSFVHREMAAYRLYTVVPRLLQFIENLTNCYVRMNRSRLKGESGSDDCKNALCTLGCVIFTMVRLMASITPFLTEFMYQNLKILTHRTEKSIHFISTPQPKSELMNEKIERGVANMRNIIDLGRVIRERKTIPVKYPLKEAVVILENEVQVQELAVLEKYIMEELNVRKLTLSSDREAYGISLRAEAEFKNLGPRLKDKFKTVMASIKSLTEADIKKFTKDGSLEVNGETLTTGDLRIMLLFTGSKAAELSQKYEINSQSEVVVLLDVSLDEDNLAEGLAREMVNRIQKLRKKAGLVPTDEITAYLQVLPKGCEASSVAEKFKDFIQNSIKSPLILEIPRNINVLIEDKQQLKGASNESAELIIKLVKGYSIKSSSQAPNCRYVTCVLNGLQPGYGTEGTVGTILLENPVGSNLLSHNDLLEEVQTLFGLFGKHLDLVDEKGNLITKDLVNFNGNVLYVVPKGKFIKNSFNVSSNFQFSNIKAKDKCGTIICENPHGSVLPLAEKEKIKRALNIFHSDGCKSLESKDIIIS